MRSTTHAQHLATRTAHQNCNECTADNSRRFCPTRTWHYDHVSFYLRFARAGFSGQGVRTNWAGSVLRGEEWTREFWKALHTRIYLKRTALPVGRKYSTGYLERLGAFHSRQDGRWFASAQYLRTFAQRRGYGN